MPGGFHVDEEEAVGAGMGAAGELGLEDEMIGVIGAGDMPFLAVQDVVPAVAPRRGLDRVDVRARLGLGDGIAFMALAADVRLDPGLHLMRRAGAGLDHPGRGRAVAPAQRIGDLADLLLDDDLLEAAEARPAEVAGMASAWRPISFAMRLCRALISGASSPPFISASTSCGISSSATKRRTFSCQARAGGGRG